MKTPFKLRHHIAAFTLALLAVPAAQAQLKIGHIGSMTGPLAALGLDQYDGFQLRVEQGDGMLGGQKVELLRMDDQSKPEVGLQAARELLQKDKVDVGVGITASNVINAVFPYIEIGRASGRERLATRDGAEAVNELRQHRIQQHD